MGLKLLPLDKLKIRASRNLMRRGNNGDEYGIERGVAGNHLWLWVKYAMSVSKNSVSSYLQCGCGEPAPIRVSWIEGNTGRRFAGCKNYKVKSCGFFVWVDLEKEPRERIHEFY
ncbi:hypothetical protein LguiA_023330 [Lonicera macranthoides]